MQQYLAVIKLRLATPKSPTATSLNEVGEIRNHLIPTRAG